VQHFPIKVDIPAFVSDGEGERDGRMSFCHPVAVCQISSGNVSLSWKKQNVGELEQFCKFATLLAHQHKKIYTECPRRKCHYSGSHSIGQSNKKKVYICTCVLFWTVSEIELFHCTVAKLLIKRHYVLFLISVFIVQVTKLVQEHLQHQCSLQLLLPIALRPFQFGLGFPYNWCPFHSIQCLRSPPFHTKLP
jgi:hypothetical protein